MARPVDWRGREIERRSRLAVGRLSEAWWARFRRRRAVTLRCAEAALLAAILAGGTWWLAMRGTVEAALARAATVEAATRAEAEMMRTRRCLEWPAWCQRERPGWWARHRKGAR